MDRQTLIITGSSGLIGRAFIQRIAADFREISFDRDSPPDPPAESEHYVPCDIGDDQSVGRALSEVRKLGVNRIASVVHLAAYYDFSGKPSPLYDEVNVRGTQRLLHGLRDFEVEQFLYASTMLVHAPCEPGQRINEDWPLEPKWDYPQSKLKTEQLIRRERGSVPIALLRIAGVYDDDCHSLPLAQQIHRIYEKDLTARVFPGNTSHGQSFVHLDDLVDALRLAVERRADLPPEAILLIGEPETLSYEEIQRTVSRLIHGEEWETQRIPKVLARTGARLQDALPGSDPFIKPWMIELADDHFALDIGRARQLLGWTPRRSLRETLPRMIALLKADPEGWKRKNKLDGE